MAPSATAAQRRTATAANPAETQEELMTAPDLAGRGLDRDHIISVCVQPSGTGRTQRVHTVRRPAGIRVILGTHRGAQAADAALARVGYLVTPSAAQRTGRDLLVTGWSPAGLETRLAAMRAVVHQLAGNPSLTAQAVIGRFRGSGSATPSPQEAFEQARTRLYAWVYARTGPCVPHDRGTVPADPRTALRLSLTRQLEDQTEGLTGRHLRAAAHALALYLPLSQQMDPGKAQDTAIRRAGTTFHLPSPPAQDTSALLEDLLHTPGPVAAPPPGSARANPGQLAARDFPAPPATTPAPGTGTPAARPGWQRIPAARPGPRH
jgi:hypothetical protein